MKEYKLSIVGVKDFVIVSPTVLGMLLQKIKESSEMKMEIPVEAIMPPNYTDYLVNILNSNQGKKQFRFRQIYGKVLESEHIYKILEYQMKSLRIEWNECFERFTLIVKNSKDEYSYTIESKNLFSLFVKMMRANLPMYIQMEDRKALFWNGKISKGIMVRYV